MKPLQQANRVSCFHEVSVPEVCYRFLVENDEKRVVCLCNQEVCGELALGWPEVSKQIFIVRSDQSGRRFELDLEEGEEDGEIAGEPAKITVDLAKPKQTILGWGGAFTDSFGYNLKNLTSDVAEKLLQSYYGKNGLRYNFGRVPMGGSDFSTRKYTYDDTEEEDYELKKWSLQVEDKELKIPVIKRAMEIARGIGTKIKLFASPWSAPGWMKTSKSIVQGSLTESDKIYTSYANYWLLFFLNYAKFGIRFWGATVQNEPLASKYGSIGYRFNSMNMGNKQMAKFVGQYLGPTLAKNGLTRDKFKLLINDDDLVFTSQISAVLEDTQAQKYIAGVGFHWYTSGLPLVYQLLEGLYENVKDKVELILSTEACNGWKPTDKKVDLGSWERGEDYAFDIIETLNRQVSGWIDWNMALDKQGGPSWAENFVDSPIIVDSERNEFYKQPMYYALAHFSRLFRPGSSVLQTTIESKEFEFEKHLLTAAVHNKESGHVVINVLNKFNHKKKIDIFLIGLNATRQVVVTEKSITSIIIKS